VVVSGREAVLEVLERFRRGWELGDAGQVLDTIAKREDVLLYGGRRAARSWSASPPNSAIRYGPGEPMPAR
jgi:hypothetical protein